jgi:prophage maintenance system killer protein
VPAQAQRVLAAFVKHRPFDRANLASGLVVALAFLVMNGYDITLDDAGLKRVVTAGEGTSSVPDLTPHIAPAREQHHSEAETRAVVESILARYAETTAALAAGVAA